MLKIFSNRSNWFYYVDNSSMPDRIELKIRIKELNFNYSLSFPCTIYSQIDVTDFILSIAPRHE